jgi:hypothetical protein
MKTLLCLLATVAGLSLGQAQNHFVVFLNGAQEVPANASPGVGSGNFFVNPDNTITYSVTYSGLTGTYAASHIHGPAGRGTNAGVVVGLVNIPNGPNAGKLEGTTRVMSAAELDALRAGLYYVNIHSSPSFGGGEIRGQLDAGSGTAVPTLSEWGLVIMGLLLLTVGTLFVIRYQPAFAVAGGISSSTRPPMVALPLFGKVLGVCLALAPVTLLAISGLFGSITGADVFGVIACAVIIGYWLHLLILTRRQQSAL